MASSACAHELRKAGHDVVVFEGRMVPGGLNTLGIAAYKISTEFALSEVELVRQTGIDLRLNQRISAPALLDLLRNFDAVFLGIGLGHTLPLGIEGFGHRIGTCGLNKEKYGCCDHWLAFLDLLF